MITSKLLVPGTTVLILIGSAGCAGTAKCGFEGCPGDAKITADVRATFEQHPDLGAPAAIRVQTSDHVVHLYGFVDTSLERDTAASLASQVPGVTRVENNLGVSR